MKFYSSRTTTVLRFGIAMDFAMPGVDATEFNGARPEKNGQPTFMPSPVPQPVYAVIFQTENPNEAVKTMTFQLPMLEVGEYTARLEIIPEPFMVLKEAVMVQDEAVKLFANDFVLFSVGLGM